MLLHLSPVSMYFQWGFPSFNFFSIFCLLISINPQLLYTFQGFFSEFSNFSSFNSYFLTHTFNSQEITNSIRKNKTKILTRGGQRSPLLLTFSRAILRPLCVIPALLLPNHSFQTPSPLHHSPNSLQLGRIPLLALHQVPEGLPDFSVLLHKLLECLHNGTQDPTISGNHGRNDGGGVGYTPLLESEGPTMKEIMKK